MRMLGRKGQPGCGSHCCGDTSRSQVRHEKRAERQAARREIEAEIREAEESAEYYDSVADYPGWHA